jgi:hypothetical protein
MPRRKATRACPSTSDSVVYDADGKRDDDEVRMEIAAHGISIYRTTKQADGTWSIVADRATAGSPPVRRWKSPARSAARPMSAPSTAPTAP